MLALVLRVAPVGVAGLEARSASIPRFSPRTKPVLFLFAIVAQSVERIHGKDEVPGSIPGACEHKCESLLE